MKNPQVSIVIIEKNQKHFLENSLAMIFLQTFENFEVIVVDSGSTDGTLEMLRGLPVKTVHIHQPKEKTFNWARAQNEAIKKARGQYIVVLSGDAVPADLDWLKNLLLCLEKKGVVATNGSYIFSLKSDILYQLWFRPIFGYLRGGEPTSFTGANFAFKKALWYECPFDETWGPGEDWAWGQTIRQKGYKIVFSQEAKVFHQHWSGIWNNIKQAPRFFLELSLLGPLLSCMRHKFSIYAY